MAHEGVRLELERHTGTLKVKKEGGSNYSQLWMKTYKKDPHVLIGHDFQTLVSFFVCSMNDNKLLSQEVARV